MASSAAPAPSLPAPEVTPETDEVRAFDRDLRKGDDPDDADDADDDGDAHSLTRSLCPP